MAASRNLKGYLRQYGYESLSGLTVAAKQGTRYNHMNNEMPEGPMPALITRGAESEWLVTMKLKDFMELFREWELRDLPFYKDKVEGSEYGKSD